MIVIAIISVLALLLVSVTNGARKQRYRLLALKPVMNHAPVP